MNEEQRQKLHEEILNRNDTFDMNDMKPIKHIWIDRGAKLTCEKAGHAYHEAWKRK